MQALCYKFRYKTEFCSHVPCPESQPSSHRAVNEKFIPRNPFTGWRVQVPKKRSTRETKEFTDYEIDAILSAALTIKPVSKADAANRWCPWLAAYSGARMGELTQLRGIDIVERDGVHAMKISPDTGTTKTGKARTVPLHEHLIEQGFVAFVKANGKGPLFYNEPKQPTAASDDPTHPRKPRYVKAREKVGRWVRGLGVNDPELSPNHAWRHTFKALGFRCGMAEKVLDAIVGHAPASVGRSYGEPTLADKAQELRKFPRYRTTPAAINAEAAHRREVPPGDVDIPILCDLARGRRAPRLSGIHRRSLRFKDCGSVGPTRSAFSRATAPA